MPETPFIERVRIRGFRSLADVEIADLPRAAVLIGTNGSGKSNVVRFFEMTSWMLGPRRLAEFVQRRGGADDQLFGGSRVSPRLSGEIDIRTDAGRNDYRFALDYAQPDRFFFSEEAFRFSRAARSTPAPWKEIGRGHTEAELTETAQSTGTAATNPTTARVIVDLLRRCAVFQFHDTSEGAPMKRRWDADDNNYLRSHGGNLAAILLRLEREDRHRFDSICRIVGRTLPVFDRFEIEESYGKVALRWKAKGTGKTFGAHLTSDGSLRFFALATLLSLPSGMLPNVLLLDEPELGLHPSAVALVGDMMRSLATERQVIAATQSPLLVDAFDLDETIVLELNEGRTEVRRFGKDEYREWLGDYAPGELWQKNLLGGRP